MSSSINFNEMIAYVRNNGLPLIDVAGFDVISQGFIKKWNKEAGNKTDKELGASDFQNATYSYLQPMVDCGEIEFIDQGIVDLTIDLILDYMTKIGQWKNNTSSG